MTRDRLKCLKCLWLLYECISHEVLGSNPSACGSVVAVCSCSFCLPESPIVRWDHPLLITYGTYYSICSNITLTGWYFFHFFFVSLLWSICSTRFHVLACNQITSGQSKVQTVNTHKEREGVREREFTGNGQFKKESHMGNSTLSSPCAATVVAEKPSDVFLCFKRGDLRAASTLDCVCARESNNMLTLPAQRTKMDLSQPMVMVCAFLVSELVLRVWLGEKNKNRF